MQFTGGSEPIAVFNVDGRFFATQDRLPRRRWSVSESYVKATHDRCALPMVLFHSLGKASGPAGVAATAHVAVSRGGFVMWMLHRGAELRPRAAARSLTCARRLS
jgi:hypothetical protein